MKKLLFPIMLAFVFVLCMPVLAQDAPEAELELGKTVVVTGPNFTFAYPTSWVHDIGQRVSVAENADDLATMVDTDNATLPAGNSITLSSVPKSAIVNALSKDDPTLDDVVTLLAQEIDIDTNFDMAIMARRAASFTGINANGRWGVASVWEIDDAYFILGVGTPEASISEEVALLHQAVAASMKQFSDTPITLADDMVEVEALGLSIPYPTDWIVGDVEADSFVGKGLFMDDAALEQWTQDGMTEEAAILILSASTDDESDVVGLTAREAAETLMSDIEAVTVEGEFWVGDAPGFGFSGLRDGSYEYVVVMTPTDDTWAIYRLIAQDQETGEAAIPTFIGVLSGISSIE